MSHPDSQQYLEAEYYHYNKQYGIGQYKDEKRLCIVGLGRNMNTQKIYREFFASLNRQNYTNFHVVVIDDASDDFTTQAMYSFVDKFFPRLRSRITFAYNMQNQGAFGNKDVGIKEYCQPGDIVIDYDVDDLLIGKQAFKLVNSAFQDEKTWILYTSYFLLNNNRASLRKKSIVDGKILVETAQQYRTSVWRTSHLKVYLMDLYKKIPFDHFASKSLDENGEIKYEYPRLATDKGMMYPLIEMAGFERLKYIP